MILTNDGRITDYGVLTIVGGELDGVRADSLRRGVLMREFTRMGVPGIDETMGKLALLDARYRQIETVAAERLWQPGKRPRRLELTVAEQAEALIAKHALSGTIDAPEASARPPTAPIATTSTR